MEGEEVEEKGEQFMGNKLSVDEIMKKVEEKKAELENNLKNAETDAANREKALQEEVDKDASKGDALKEEQDKNKQILDQMRNNIEQQVKDYEEELKKINGIEQKIYNNYNY